MATAGKAEFTVVYFSLFTEALSHKSLPVVSKVKYSVKTQPSPSKNVRVIRSSSLGYSHDAPKGNKVYSFLAIKLFMGSFLRVKTTQCYAGHASWSTQVNGLHKQELDIGI